ncbi:MAG TPA: protein kinase, partial [Terracidiphilus sp.]
MSALRAKRWQEISPYLDHALSLTEDGCRAWLQSFRTEKPELAELVAKLLEEHRAIAEEHFLERGPATVAKESSLAGQTIGAYRIVAPIGQGGMGSVWLAERSDGRFERHVAIKFLHLSVSSGGAARFKREGRILGQLSHPNIAELIDAGLTPNGEPYLVLEHVEGEHIDEYCDKRSLDVDARILLFLDVLNAVTHAHANLIVHRDLKPSNVLVRIDGEVKLLDFGIAKLLADDVMPGQATLLTLEGGAALTPQFAAPEQLTGGPISTATDVYALGVLLYLLLTGQHPVGSGTRSPADLVKAITDTEPPLPSEVVTSTKTNVDSLAAIATHRSSTPEKLRRLLRGDLDTIISKALKKNSAERYVAVTALADDLQHYLKEEPISARPDSFTYRASKFVRRNKLGVALTAVVLIGIASALVVIRREAKRADYRFQQVRKLAHTVLFDVNPQIELLAGSTPARELLVKTSLQYLDSLSAEAGNDSRLQLEVAEAYNKIGDVQGNPNYANLGHPEAAVESYTKAAAIAGKLRSSPDALEILATAYSNMGTVQARLLGLSSQGRENMRLATTIADSIPRLTGKPVYRLRLLAYGFLGDLDVLVDPVRAAEPVRHSLDIAREWAQADSDREAKFLVAVLTREWADVLWETGDLNAARDALMESLATFREVLANDPNNGDWLREEYLVEERMGLVSGHPDYFNLGDRKAAAEWSERYMHSCERLGTVDPSDARARSNLSNALASLADIYRDSDPHRAIRLYQRALAVSDSVLQTDPQDSEILYADSSDRVGFALALERIGEHKQAADQWQHAIDVLEVLRKRDSATIAVPQLLGVALQNRASMLTREGDFRAAEQDLQRSNELLAFLYQQNPRNLMILRDLANCYRQKGKLAEHRSKWPDAEREYQKSLELWRRWLDIGKSSVYDQRQREMAATLARNA